jgi:lipocalin
VAVLNRGHKIDEPSKIDEAKGKAWIPDPKHPAQLKVSFFWPFSGDYWVLYLDPDYKYVLVGEPALKYLWILSRTPQLEETVVQDLLAKARGMGYNTDGAIRVEHDCK